MTTYLVTDLKGADGLNLVVHSAREALSTVHELERNRFTVVVLDERGHQRSIEELQTRAAIEAENDERK